MPPILAIIVWFILLVALWRFDPAKDPESSPALWLPLIWLFFLASRLPSQWLGLTGGRALDAYQEGNLFDRVFFSVLILMAVFVLLSRSIKWADFFVRNFALVLLLCYALVSVAWSDFPFISFKRWFRDLGVYMMILVVLSDQHPMEAVRTLLRRLGYLLIPLSVVLIKYYPELGKGYSFWTGEAYFQGVTTTKNMLGAVCLVSGLFFFWDTLARWERRREWKTKRILLVNAAFLGMTLWLLNLANSATSSLCLGIGCLVIAAAHSNLFRRHPGGLKTLIPVSICLYLILEFGFNINDVISRAVGRDPTLTTRTELWSMLVKMHVNPILGTGYESFWLGARLLDIWRDFDWGINQAHNGYLELYLNLGLVGLFLLVVFLIASYSTICKRLSSSPSSASLSLALWTALLFYNVTEAAFKIHLMWVAFLLGALAIPVRFKRLVPGSNLDWLPEKDSPRPPAAHPLEMAGHRR